MALLAVIDVEDLASEKVAKVKGALDDLINQSAKAQSAGGGPATQRTKQQTDALEELIESQKRSTAQTIAHARAFEVVNQSMKVGTQITPLQAKAFQQLGTGLMQNTEFAKKFGTQMQQAMGQVTAGAPVTKALLGNLNQLQQGFQQTATGAKGMGNALQGFKAEAAAAAAAFGLIAGGALALLKDAGMAAARIETMGVVMGIVAKNARLSSTEMMIQVEATKKLGITTQEANDSVLQFVQSGLKLSDASKIARVAQDLAVIAGENSSATYQRLTRAIQTSETMLLRQVGIVTTNEMIWREYAQTIGKTVGQLTQAEKRQAFVNKIMEEGKKAAGAYEASLTTVGKQMSSMARYVTEAALALGNHLLPLMSQLVKWQTESLKYLAGSGPGHPEVRGGGSRGGGSDVALRRGYRCRGVPEHCVRRGEGRRSVQGPLGRSVADCSGRRHPSGDRRHGSRADPHRTRSRHWRCCRRVHLFSG